MQNGKITGRGPIFDNAPPHGAGIVYLAYPGDAKPDDVPPDQFKVVLPLPATVDMSTLDNNYIKVISPLFEGKIGWCKLTRFTPDTVPPPPDDTVTYQISGTITLKKVP